MPSLLIILPVKQISGAVAGGGEKQEARGDFREGQAKPYNVRLGFYSTRCEASGVTQPLLNLRRGLNPSLQLNRYAN